MKDRKLLDLAKGQSCIRCGANDGTVVPAHYQGFRSHSFGKATGLKPSDVAVAHLCHRCHCYFDSNESSDYEDAWARKIDRSEQFQHYIILTLIRLFKQGRIVVK